MQKEKINFLSKIGRFLTAKLDKFVYRDFLKKQLPPEEYKNLMKIYLKILDFTGPSADIPEDLQQFWIDNQDEFDLKGKYLPQSSNLYKYKK